MVIFGHNSQIFFEKVPGVPGKFLGSGELSGLAQALLGDFRKQRVSEQKAQTIDKLFTFVDTFVPFARSIDSFVRLVSSSLVL